MFVPVVPLFEALRSPAAAPALTGAQPLVLVSSSSSSSSSSSTSDHKSVLLPMGDVNRFLQEQQRSIDEKNAALAKIFPPAVQPRIEANCPKGHALQHVVRAATCDKCNPTADQKHVIHEAYTCVPCNYDVCLPCLSQLPPAKLVSLQEARLLVALLHGNTLAQCWSDGVNYIESMLRKQLVAAIGKEVSVVLIDCVGCLLFLFFAALLCFFFLSLLRLSSSSCSCLSFFCRFSLSLLPCV